jgi:hypothetical protein
MDALDVVILASMVVLAGFFASVAAMEWRDGRSRANQRPDAQIIQHPQRDRRASAA